MVSSFSAGSSEQEKAVVETDEDAKTVRTALTIFVMRQVALGRDKRRPTDPS